MFWKKKKPVELVSYEVSINVGDCWCDRVPLKLEVTNMNQVKGKNRYFNNGSMVLSINSSLVLSEEFEDMSK